MANPKVEDGHTKIANELIEVFARVNFTAHESRILWCILRHTYGWNKEMDRISYSQFQKETGIDRRHVGRSLSSLKARRVILCSGNGYLLEYGLQKDYDLWVKIDTKQGNDLPPSEAINLQEYPENLPPSGDNLPPFQDALPPSEATNLPPSQGTTKERKHLTKASNKSKREMRTFGEAKNVTLTPKEYEELIKRFGEQGANWWIDELSLAKASKGYKSKSDYFTILSWERRGKSKGGASGADKKHPGAGQTKRTAEDARASLRGGKRDG